MIGPEIEIRGDQLAKALRERVPRLQGGVAQSVGRACQLVTRSAKQRAPKDTGLLRRSITFRVVRDGEDIVGQVGTNVHYAIHVEYGHRTANKNDPGAIRYVPGTYFLTNALRENRGKVRAMLMEGMQKS